MSQKFPNLSKDVLKCPKLNFNFSFQDVNNKDNFATLIIDVLDDNDHEPKFMADLIQTRLPDNADLGSSVIQVQAYDSDHGINGELRYSILHGNKDDMFVIDPILGNIILAKELDLNSQITEFMLMIKASDQSIDDKKSATIPVHILLTSGITFLYYLLFELYL